MEAEQSGGKGRLRWLIVAALGVMLAAFIILTVSGEGARPASKNRETVEDNCELVQTLRYARCGHEVVRRVRADKEYKGCTLQQMQQAYAEWDITSFSPSEIQMSRSLAIYCPQHLVVLPDGAGVLGIYENAYGDGYALKTQLDIPLTALPDSMRETVHLGLGFSGAEEVESWLESLES